MRSLRVVIPVLVLASAALAPAASGQAIPRGEGTFTLASTSQAAVAFELSTSGFAAQVLRDRMDTDKDKTVNQSEYDAAYASLKAQGENVTAYRLDGIPFKMTLEVVATGIVGATNNPAPVKITVTGAGILESGAPPGTTHKLSGSIFGDIRNIPANITITFRVPPDHRITDSEKSVLLDECSARRQAASTDKDDDVNITFVFAPGACGGTLNPADFPDSVGARRESVTETKKEESGDDDTPGFALPALIAVAAVAALAFGIRRRT